MIKSYAIKKETERAHTQALHYATIVSLWPTIFNSGENSIKGFSNHVKTLQIFLKALENFKGAVIIDNEVLGFLELEINRGIISEVNTK